MVADQLTRLRRFLEAVFPTSARVTKAAASRSILRASRTRRTTPPPPAWSRSSAIAAAMEGMIEIDHRHGLKTRFGHLAPIYVAVGQRVAIGTKLGGIGSTGRLTRSRLAQVRVDGRLQNPERFLEAGQYVQQATE